MKKILIILTIIFSTNISAWKISFHNVDKTERVHFSVDTTQNYPCGPWYCAGLCEWCNCGPGKDINPNSTEDYHFDGVCIGACTSKIYTNKGVSVNLLGGVGACSDVEVWTGRDKDGKWFIYSSDWTNSFASFFTNNIEPILEAGFRFSDLIPKAQDAAKYGGKIGRAVTNFTREFEKPNGPIYVVKQLTNKIDDFKKQVQDLNNQTSIHVKDIKTNLGDLMGPKALEAIGKLLDNVKQVGEDVNKAANLLNKIKPTIDSLVQTINDLNLKPSIATLKELLDIIKNLISSIRSIIDDMPTYILNHNALGPLGEIVGDLQAIDTKLTELQNTPLYNIEQLSTKLLNGVLDNIANIDAFISKITNTVNIISQNANNLSKAITKISASADVISSVISQAKDKLISDMKKPENIALMIPIAVTLLPATALSVATFGLATPAIVAVLSPAIIASAQPLIMNILKPLLKQAHLENMVGGINELVTAVNNIITQGVNTINEFQNLKIALVPDQTAKLLNDLVPITNKSARDVTNLNNVIPSLL